MAGDDVVELAQCADEPWVTWTRGQFCHDWLLHTLRSTGREPRIAHTAAEHQTQLALVVVRPVRPPLTRQVHAVWRAEADRRPAIHAAVAAMVSSSGSGGSGGA